jgi:hypothetical protein
MFALRATAWIVIGAPKPHVQCSNAASATTACQSEGVLLVACLVGCNATSCFMFCVTTRGICYLPLSLCCCLQANNPPPRAAGGQPYDILTILPVLLEVLQLLRSCYQLAKQLHAPEQEPAAGAAAAAAADDMEETTAAVEMARVSAD